MLTNEPYCKVLPLWLWNPCRKAESRKAKCRKASNLPVSNCTCSGARSEASSSSRPPDKSFQTHRTISVIVFIYIVVKYICIKTHSFWHVKSWLSLRNSLYQHAPLYPPPLLLPLSLTLHYLHQSSHCHIRAIAWSYGTLTIWQSSFKDTDMVAAKNKIKVKWSFH